MTLSKYNFISHALYKLMATDSVYIYVIAAIVFGMLIFIFCMLLVGGGGGGGGGGVGPVFIIVL